MDLEEDFIDWFFLHYFNKDSSYWRNLTDDKLIKIITLEQEKEKEYWVTWQKILKNMMGGR